MTAGFPEICTGDNTCPKLCDGCAKDIERHKRAALHTRRTIDASDNPALLAGVKSKNNGRYNNEAGQYAS